MDKITMLGTGHAMTFDCFNTCFVYENENGKLLVDTGGGKQLLAQLNHVGISTGELQAVFISHRHTDHILGLPWLFRSIGGPGSDKPLTLYLHEDVMGVAKGMLELLFPEKLEEAEKHLRFVPVQDGGETEILGRRVQFMDLHSPNVPQFGFSMLLGNGKRFVFHGDVPFEESNRERITGADYLMHEAFHLATQKPGMPGKMPMPGGKGPGKMGHSTVKEAAGYGKSLGVKTMILVHGTDSGLLTRKQDYIHEAQQVFDGELYAPNDFDVIELK